MWLYIIAIGAIIIIIIRGMMQRSDPTKSYILKPVTWLDLKNKVRYDVQEDYLNPNNEVKYDPNTQEPYVERKTGMMDKGDKRLPLNDYHVVDANGFKLYLNNIEVIDKVRSLRLAKIYLENKSLKNRLAEKISENIKLTTKLENALGERIDQFGDFSKKLPYFVPQKKK